MKYSSYHKGDLIESRHGFNIIDCESCGFKHVFPLPESDDLAQIYSEEYYSDNKPLYIEHYLEDKDWWDCVYEERYSVLERLIPSSKKSLLDIGSGPGLFLDFGRRRGWEVKGIEPSKLAADYSRNELGLDIENIFLDKNNAKNFSKFDVVSMFEVLEHLNNPIEIINIAKSMLKPNGVLVVVVPNDFNPFQTIAREHLDIESWWVSPPHHLNYFDKHSLENVMNNNGLSVIEEEVSFPLEMFLLMGINYIGDDKIGRNIHEYRKNFDLAFQGAENKNIKKNFYQSLNKLGLGREICLYLRKNYEKL